MDARDFVGQISDGRARHDQARDRLKAIATSFPSRFKVQPWAMLNSRIAMESGTNAMEVVALEDEYTEYPNDVVGAIGKGGVCLECGWMAHFARECSLRGGKKGTGKGDPGKGCARRGAGKGKS